MASQSINVGVIGAGAIAQDHLRSLRRMSAVGELFVFDIDVKRAAQVAREMGAKAVGSRAELLERCEIAWICTPPFTHVEDVRAACAAGKAVFCEKPLAHSLGSALMIERLVRESGIRFFMGHSGRYTAPFVLMRRLLKEGVVGRPHYFFSTRLGRLDPTTSSPWRIDDRLSGGAIIELGVHEIDFISWMTGGDGWHQVYATSGNTLVGPQFQDSLVAIGTHESGIVSRVEISWSSARYLWERGVQGEEGQVLYFNDTQFNTLMLHRSGREPVAFTTDQSNWKDEETGENLSLREQAGAVLRALATGNEPPVGFDDGLGAVAVAAAMSRSAGSGAVEAVSNYDNTNSPAVEPHYVRQG